MLYIGSNMSFFNYFVRFNLLILLVSLVVFQCVQSQSFAQETVPNQEFKSSNTFNSTRSLTNRLESLEKNLQDISKIIYKNSSNQSGVVASGSAPTKNTSNNSPSIQRMTANELRMSELESEFRRLTGLVETASNDVNVMSLRIDKLVEDLDLRLKSIESIVLNLKSISDQFKEPDTAANSEAPQKNALQERLDKVTPDSQINQSVLPKTDPEKQYAFARGLLMKLDYQSAELAFKEFIDLNKEHKLSSNAYYWLGEVYYVRKGYAEAAGAFIDSYKLFPLGNKAPDSLLKLGMSLAELGNNNEACESFEELLLKFPEASSRLRRRALQESVRIGCKN